MAIGDAIGIVIGTATGVRQPSSGVAEQISALMKNGTTDEVDYYNGSNIVEIYLAGVTTGTVQGTAAGPLHNPYNTAMIINNTYYLKKAGSTDEIHMSGVQVDA